MQLDLYQINAFTEQSFGGNPACVVPLQHWLPDDLMLKIAKENAVPETAFFIDKSDKIHLRWFTPEIEMDLCGHATVATAHGIRTILGNTKDELVFESLSGELIVSVVNGLYQLNFPARPPQPHSLPDLIGQALNIKPREVLKSRDYVLVYDSEADIRNIKVNKFVFDQVNLGVGGVVVTAPGAHCDFVSRFFSPQASIMEDPVTGSSHCSLIPYWSEKLNKQQLDAMQLSDRLGKVYCENKGDRVLIGGHAKTYSIGKVWVE